jgi:catechol 2,3-dioxygenase-like lactoylglutathione lyase family enzyme
VRVEAPDLDKMETFLLDFGLVRSARTETALYMRGLDDEGYVHVTTLADEPRVVGWAFDANDVSDLQHLASIDGFSAVEPLDGPGGGLAVRSTDPDGFQIEIVADRSSVGALSLPTFPERNEATDYKRKGTPVRLPSSPSHVKRLGHCLVTVKDYGKSFAWYHEHLGLVVSDEVHTDEGAALGAFLRCDRGKEYTDHHTLGLIGSGETSFNHCAFEVPNLDDLMLGNSLLSTNGYEHQMGIGRHVLGSQIFDYWRDPWGNVLEHWTDGDLFNDESPPNITDMETLRGDQWGPNSTAKHMAAAS